LIKFVFAILYKWQVSFLVYRLYTWKMHQFSAKEKDSWLYRSQNQHFSSPSNSEARCTISETGIAFLDSSSEQAREYHLLWSPCLTWTKVSGMNGLCRTIAVLTKIWTVRIAYIHDFILQVFKHNTTIHTIWANLAD